MTYTVRDVILYVVGTLKVVDGMKKLMKLLFLVQYDVPRIFVRNVTKYLYENEPVCRGEFYIWSYGPFMVEVYDVVDEYLEVNDAKPPYEIRLPVDFKMPSLPEPIRRRVNHVLSKYGKKRGWELEKMICKRLRLDNYKKSEYMGISVDEYVTNEIGNLRRVDLAESI